MWIAMQQIVSWQSRSVYAYEALLRTDEPTLRNPLDFVEAAERLGRTAELGRAVRKQIADQIAHGPKLATVFVNLHPSDLVDEVRSCAPGTGPFASVFRSPRALVFPE
jgi:EAL domain-containing protein (putative c-di-GMP-specific phosphodiesterase class I)